MGEAAVMISGVGVIIGSWFTPFSVFIFLNLVIATIFIMSRFAAPIITQTLAISPQVLLDPLPSLLKRVKPFNFPLQYNKNQPTTQVEETPCPKKNNPQEPQQLAPSAPSLFEVSVHEEEEEESSGSEEEDSTEGRGQLREEEEHEELEEEEEEEGEGVDAKADDFITMFKKQLRLQRVESNLSFEQMLE